MPVYFIFLIAAIGVAICSDKIDETVNGKLKKTIIVSCAAVVILVSFVIKFAV